MKNFKEVRKELKTKGIKISDARCTLNGEKAYNVFVEGGRSLMNAAQIVRAYYEGDLF
jgi:hypothetical protein